MVLQASEAKELPAREAIAQHRQEQLAIAAIEAAVWSAIVADQFVIVR